MDDKNSFIVYADDIKETLDELTDEQVAALFRSMVDYQITGEEPKLSGMLKLAFIPIRQQMDRDNAKWQRTKVRRAEAGRKGGLRSGEVRRDQSENEANEAKLHSVEANEAMLQQHEANEANEAVNVNVNDNVNVDVNVNVSDSFASESDGAASLSSSLISYLNKLSGGKYKPTKETTKRIGSLLAEGYTEADMRGVIDKKVAEWKDSPKMKGYLRPSTLFGDKFEEYVSAPVPVEVEKKQSKARDIEHLKRERDSKAENLASIVGRLEQLRASPGGVRANTAEYRELKEQEAIAEDTIKRIDGKIERLMA